MFKVFNLFSSGSQSWLLGHCYFTYFLRYIHLHLKNFLAAFCIPLCTSWINLRLSTHLSHFLPSGLSSENLPRDTSEVPIASSRVSCATSPFPPLCCLSELGQGSLSHSHCSGRDRNELSFPSPPNSCPCTHWAIGHLIFHLFTWDDDNEHGLDQCGSPGEPHKPSVKLGLHHQPLALVVCTEEPGPG